MTVAELKEVLEYYDDDMEVVFNLDWTIRPWKFCPMCGEEVEEE